MGEACQADVLIGVLLEYAPSSFSSFTLFCLVVTYAFGFLFSICL